MVTLPNNAEDATWRKTPRVRRVGRKQAAPVVCETWKRGSGSARTFGMEVEDTVCWHRQLLDVVYCEPLVQVRVNARFEGREFAAEAAQKRRGIRHTL